MFSLVTFVVDNKWNKDLIVKQTIIRGSPAPSTTPVGDNQATITKEYSVPASKLSGFHYLSVSTADLDSTSRFQFEESESRLLVVLPNGDDHIHVEHRQYQQNFHVTILNASKCDLNIVFMKKYFTIYYSRRCFLSISNIFPFQTKFADTFQFYLLCSPALNFFIPHFASRRFFSSI